jgi:hypothetical protein
MIFDEIWRMRRRQNKLLRVYRQKERILRKNYTEEEIDSILQSYQAQFGDLGVSIKIAESDVLVGRAQTLKVPLPSRSDKEAWDDFFGPEILTPRAYASLRSAIRQEQKERKEAVVSVVKDIVSPIGGLIISILSLLIAYAALKLKH